MMRAGLLRDRIVIQSPTVTQSATGEPQTTWQNFAIAWAQIESLTARDFISAQQSQSEITTKITIRFVAGITSQMRIQAGARLFEIISPPLQLSPSDRSLQLMCRELLT